MIKRTIIIEDDLDDRCDNVREALRDDFISWLKDNMDVDDFNLYREGQGGDVRAEISHSNTPDREDIIKGLFYLYGKDFEYEYEGAGGGRGTEANHKQLTINYYLSAKAEDYMVELHVQFDEAESMIELLNELTN